MWKKKLGVIAMALVGFGFGFAPGTNAGTEVIRDYSNEGPAYNYAPPPPRPIYYAPPPPVNVLVFPAYGYYGPRYVGVHHRFAGRHFYARPHHPWRY
jgi:hypothetical protein